MRIRELFEKKADRAPVKITRDTFLYMKPQGDEDIFAQCGSCRMYIPGSERCAILGPNVHVPEIASCGLYIHGEPDDDQDSIALHKPKEVGLVRREVRCENCASFDDGTCRLFETLNETQPELFDLDTQVEAKGCCNAQTPK